MGQFNSINNEALKRSAVKLQAQKMTDYNGSAIKWHSWKKRTRATMGTAGMLQILDSVDYAEKHEIDNQTIFHMLQAATVEGYAAHLVDKYEDTRDGHAAYSELVKWYEGDELTTDTAEDVRAKLDKTFLNTRTSASQYVNDFMQYAKQLDDLNESYTESKTIQIFLDQITDPDYNSTKSFCIENKKKLIECIERVRSCERRLTRENASGGKKVLRMRRVSKQDDEIHNKNDSTIDIENFKTEKGYYSIPNELWRDIDDSDKEKIKNFNGKLRRSRKADQTNVDGEFDEGKSFTQRRCDTKSNTQNKKLRTVEIRDNPEIPTEGNEEHEERDDVDKDDSVTPRREILRFQLNEQK